MQPGAVTTSISMNILNDVVGVYLPYNPRGIYIVFYDYMASFGSCSSVIPASLSVLSNAAANNSLVLALQVIDDDWPFNRPEYFSIGSCKWGYITPPYRMPHRLSLDFALSRVITHVAALLTNPFRGLNGDFGWYDQLTNKSIDSYCVNSVKTPYGINQVMYTTVMLDGSLWYVANLWDVVIQACQGETIAPPAAGMEYPFPALPTSTIIAPRQTVVLSAIAYDTPSVDQVVFEYVEVQAINSATNFVAPMFFILSFQSILLFL
jgi:hypothetical protein